jgi:hypothetical protein
MMTSSKQWPQSTEAAETKCTKPLHLQDHKNESSIIIRCMQITKDHNNAKKNSFLCPFSIDSWWKTSMVILSQVETKNNKEKTWCTKKTWWTKKIHDQSKTAYILSSSFMKFSKDLTRWYHLRTSLINTPSIDVPSTNIPLR